MSKYRRAFDTRARGIYGLTEKSFKRYIARVSARRQQLSLRHLGVKNRYNGGTQSGVSSFPAELTQARVGKFPRVSRMGLGKKTSAYELISCFLASRITFRILLPARRPRSLRLSDNKFRLSTEFRLDRRCAVLLGFEFFRKSAFALFEVKVSFAGSVTFSRRTSRCTSAARRVPISATFSLLAGTPKSCPTLSEAPMCASAFRLCYLRCSRSSSPLKNHRRIPYVATLT
jgi:hypothetical protein